MDRFFYLLIFLIIAWFFIQGGCGVILIPEENFDMVGRASWYSEKDPGVLKTTANNEEFDDEAMTAAMWDVPFHTRILVTNRVTGESVIVRINDRGPHRRYQKKGRVIDLSKAAFAEIGALRKGLIPVGLKFLGVEE